MRKRIGLLVVLAIGAVEAPSETAAAVFLDEVMADPGTWDWNQDGMLDSVADEYVEIVNRGVREVDLAGWTLSDEFGDRHTFALNTVLRPGGSIVIFGGGGPNGIPGRVVPASTGQLGLSNSGDTVTLSDGASIVDSVSFADGSVSMRALVATRLVREAARRH